MNDELILSNDDIDKSKKASQFQNEVESSVYRRKLTMPSKINKN